MGQCASKSKTLSSTQKSSTQDHALALEIEPSETPDRSKAVLSVAYRNFKKGTLSAKEFAGAFKLPPENPYLFQLMSIMDTVNAEEDKKAGFIEFVLTMAALSFGVSNLSEAPARFCWQLINWRQEDVISNESLVKVLEGMNVSKEVAFAREIAVLASEEKAVFDFATFHNVIYSKPKYTSLQKATLLYNGLKEYLAPSEELVRQRGCTPNKSYTGICCQPTRLQRPVGARSDADQQDNSKEDPKLLENMRGLLTALKPKDTEPGSPQKATFQINEDLQGDSRPDSQGGRRRERERNGLAIQVTEAVNVDFVAKSEAVTKFLMGAMLRNSKFKDFDRPLLSALIWAMTQVLFVTDDTIMTQGEEWDKTFYVLESGELNLVQDTPDKQEVINLCPGESFGDIMEHYDYIHYAESTIKCQSNCSLWRIERHVFDAVKIKYNEQKLELLDGVPSFKLLNAKHRTLLVDSLKAITLLPGEYIIRQGEMGNRFYILQEGEVEVIDDKNNNKVVRQMGAGSAFGERALLAEEKRSMSIQAISACTCWYLDRATFIELMGPLEEVVRWTLLRQEPMMSGLADREVTTLMKKIVLKHVAPGEVIFKAGDVANTFQIIEDGHVAIVDDLPAFMKEFNEDCAMDFGQVLEKGGNLCDITMLTDQNVARYSAVAIKPTLLMTLKRSDLALVFGSDLKRAKSAWVKHTLISVPALKNLPSKTMTELVEQVTVKTFEANNKVVVQGDKAESMFVVQRGAVSIRDGDAEIRCLKPGAYFGELALLEKAERTATVIAVGSCTMLEVTNEVFSRMLGPLKDQFAKHAKENYKRASAVVYKKDPKYEITDMSALEKIAVLGEGGYALVLLVRFKGQLLALKILNKAHVIERNLAKHVIQERDICIACTSPYIVNVLGTHQDRMHLYILMEPVLGGELFSYLEQFCINNDRGIKESTAKFYAACTVMAFEYLQDRDYIYRDLKPENMLIDSSGYLKLTDLGFAKHLPEGKAYTTCGTLDYMAPEMLEKTGHNKAVDWWALGCVIFEMVSGLPPFYKSVDNREKVLRIRKAKYKIPPFMSKECRDIVRRLIEPQALKRLGNTREGVSAIRSHPWFDDIDWEAMENRTHPVPYIPTTKTAAFQKWHPGYKHPAGPKFNRAPQNENGAFDNF